MKLVQLFVPDADREAVRETLEGMDVSYLFSDEASHRDGVIAYVPVPSGAVDGVLERLYDAGLAEETYTVVTDADRATIPNVDELTAEYVEGPKGDRGISHPQIRERAADLKPDTTTYVAFAVLSAFVAVGGLLLDSAIVIVGAMVIAPFAGSTLSASVGAVISDHEMVVDSATSQALGLVVAFVGAVLMSLTLQLTGFVPETLVVSRVDQISAFATPNALMLVIALAAGVAGALALATDLPVSIAGVAVAAAIVPAVSAAGIGVVWGRPLLVLGALVLLFMNIVFINLAAYAALLWLGYRSSIVRNVREHAHLSVRSGTYALVVLVFVVAVAATSAGTYQHLVFERTVIQEVESTLDDPAYDSLGLVSVTTEYNDRNALGQTESVTVTVTRTDDATHDRLAEELQENVSDATGQPVSVDVRYVDYQEERAAASPGESGANRLLDGIRAGIDAVGARLDSLADRGTHGAAATHAVTHATHATHAATYATHAAPSAATQ